MLARLKLRERDWRTRMANPKDVELLFRTVKARFDASKQELFNMLKIMVEHGLAKEIEDGYGGDYVMTIIADPETLKQIDYYVYDEGDDEPEFWNEATGEPILDKIEWY
jgi:hypothetical protein